MKKLLFITPELPYPTHSGGKSKSAKLIESLAMRYQITFVSPLKLEDEENLEKFHEWSPCDRHLHVPVNIPRSATRLAKSYLKNHPLNVERTISKLLQDKVADEAHCYDIVFLDHYEVHPYLPPDFNGLVVYHAHNAYFKIWERYAQLPGNLALRAASWLEAHRVKRYESKVAAAADLVFAAPNDGAELIACGVRADSVHDTYHLGDDSQLELPGLTFNNTDKALMYVGFLGWEPNVNGLLWFIAEIWPILQGQHPDLRFNIVGKNPDKRLRDAVSATTGIALKGYVQDLQPLYLSSRVSVAPLLFGSGMKVKVLDAMARGIPTVTTSVGAEGIDVVDGQHLLIADEPQKMAAAINNLLTNEQLWEHLQRSSRHLIRERYTWSQLFAAMHRAIDKTIRIHNRRVENDCSGALASVR